MKLSYAEACHAAAPQTMFNKHSESCLTLEAVQGRSKDGERGSRGGCGRDAPQSQAQARRLWRRGGFSQGEHTLQATCTASHTISCSLLSPEPHQPVGFHSASSPCKPHARLHCRMFPASCHPWGFTVHARHASHMHVFQAIQAIVPCNQWGFTMHADVSLPPARET